MRHLRPYTIFNTELFESQESIESIESEIKDILLELVDSGYICKVITPRSDRIIITIGNGCTTGFNQFLFKRIQSVCFRIIRYVISSDPNWIPTILKVVDSYHSVSLKTLSFENIKNNLETEEDISGGSYSNEFRIIFKK